MVHISNQKYSINIQSDTEFLDKLYLPIIKFSHWTFLENFLCLLFYPLSFCWRVALLLSPPSFDFLRHSLFYAHMPQFGALHGNVRSCVACSPFVRIFTRDYVHFKDWYVINFHFSNFFFNINFIFTLYVGFSSFFI